jgi:hypothetical protein
MSCEDEPPIFTISQDKNLIDTGIYDSDSVNISNQEDVINELEEFPQVGLMSPMIRDELILESFSCTDILVSSACWEDVKTSKSCKWDQI